MADSESDQKYRQRLLERTRDELAADARSVSESLDRNLLALSSAFLGGSLAFIGQIVELGSAVYIWVLYVAWSLFALTIALTIASFLYGLSQYPALRNAAKEYYIDGKTEAREVSARVERVALRFAYAYGVLFILGIGLLAAFITANLATKGSAMPLTPPPPQRIQKSIPPSTFQEPAAPAPASPGSTGAQPTAPANPGTGSTGGQPATPAESGSAAPAVPQQPTAQQK